MKKSSRLKKVGVVLLLVGILLGIAQTFFYHKATTVRIDMISKSVESDEPSIGCLAISPECGVCLHEEVNGFCIEYQKKYARGFPLFTTGSGINYKTNQPLGIGHLLNLLLFLIPGIVALIADKRIKHENNKNTARS